MTCSGHTAAQPCADSSPPGLGRFTLHPLPELIQAAGSQAVHEKNAVRLVTWPHIRGLWKKGPQHRCSTEGQSWAQVAAP